MNSFQKHDGGPARIALLTAFIISLILLLSQRDGPNFTKPAQRKAEDVVSPISQVLSIPIRRVEAVIFGFKDRRRAYAENLELRAELAGLRDNQARLDLLQLKIKRYERIISTNVDAEIPSEKIVARAVSETNGPFVRSLLLNAGAQNGISIGNPVMTADGLIGHVINTGQNSARVLRLGDLNSRIPVINRRSEGKAILSGDNSERPVLAFVQNTKDWVAGDVIITSGDDGMLPMGLPVGKVIKTKTDDLLVRLHAENTLIDWVWVSPFKPIIAPSDEETAAKGEVENTVQNITETEEAGAP